MPPKSKKSESLSQTLSPITAEEPVELTDAEKAKQDRLAKLALARQKAHQVLKEKKEAQMAEKEEKERLARENAELKAKMEAEKKAAEAPKPTISAEPTTLPEEVVEEEVVIVKKPKKSAPKPIPAPKKKKKIVYVEESSSESETESETESDSEEEEVVYRKPKSKKKAVAKPTKKVADPISSMSRQTVREDLRKMQMQMLYSQMFS